MSEVREKKKKKLRFLRTVRKSFALGRLLWPHVRPYGGLFATGLGLSAVLVALRVAQPWPLKYIIDSLSGKSLSIMPGLSDNRPLGVLAMSGAYIVIAVAAAACDYSQRIVLSGLGNRVVHRFRTLLFSHILQLPLVFHARRETGELITRVVYDTARLRQGMRALLVQICQNIFLFLMVVVVLVSIDTRLATIMAMSGIVSILMMGGQTVRIRRASAKSRRREGKLASVVGEAMLGVRELQAFRPGEEAGDRFDAQNKKSLKEEQKVRRMSAGLLLRVEVVLAVTIALILWVGSVSVEAGDLTPGDLVLFAAYAVALYRPYRQFARQSARIGRTLACADRLRSIMERPAFGNDSPDAIDPDGLSGDIVFDTVSLKSPKKDRGGRERILNKISFHISPGERVAVVGPNGSGKSTVLALTLRLIDPSKGAVRVDGEDLRAFRTRSLRRNMSVVFQDSVFFGLSIRENIALGHDNLSRGAIEIAARRSKTDVLAAGLEDGYDTVLKKGGRSFSAGERQRIAIARALAREGDIWLLDEPTTSLDAEVARELIGMLLDVTRGRTALWVTHRDDVVAHMDRVISLDHGGVTFEGSVTEYRGWRGERSDAGAAGPHRTEES